MYGFALEDVAVWDVDEDIEQRLCDSYALNKAWDSIGCSLEAIERDEADSVEDAERDDIMQADYAEADEVKLSLRSPNHGRLFADAVRLEGGRARLAVLLGGFVLVMSFAGDEDIDENPQQFCRCRKVVGGYGSILLLRGLKCRGYMLEGLSSSSTFPGGLSAYLRVVPGFGILFFTCFGDVTH